MNETTSNLSQNKEENKHNAISSNISVMCENNYCTRIYHDLNKPDSYLIMEDVVTINSIFENDHFYNKISIPNYIFEAIINMLPSLYTMRQIAFQIDQIIIILSREPKKFFTSSKKIEGMDIIRIALNHMVDEDNEETIIEFHLSDIYSSSDLDQLIQTLKNTFDIPKIEIKDYIKRVKEMDQKEIDKDGFFKQFKFQSITIKKERY